MRCGDREVSKVVEGGASVAEVEEEGSGCLSVDCVRKARGWGR